MTQTRSRLNFGLTLLAGLCLAPAVPAVEPAAAAAPAGAKVPGGDPVPYALGVFLGRPLDSFDLSETEFKAVLAGLTDSYHHRAAVDPQRYGPQLQSLERTRMAAALERTQQEGQAYLAKAAASPGATKTDSGLVYRSLTAGNGASPASTDEVQVRYIGRRVDGTVFDRSPGTEGVSFALNGVIPCWTQAVTLMRVGGKARVVCPPELAYGDRGAPPMIRPASTLDFEIELLGITPAAAPAAMGPAATPTSPAEAPPPDAAPHD
jgi:FKBP-type peptidyl-prolyl cis-trans isomerase